MDKARVELLGQSLREMLKKKGEDWDITFKVGTIRYDAHGFRCTIEAHEVSGQGDVRIDMKARAEWIEWAQIIGMKAEDFGATFLHGGRTFTITGYNGRKRRFPVMTTRDDGHPMNFTLLAVKVAMGREIDEFDREQARRGGR
jgi:hypothetical protein